MRPVVTTVTLTGGVANSLATSQSLGGAGDLVLVSATPIALDIPRRIGITSAGNDSGITWTVTGYARSEMGSPKLVETIAGADVGTAQTTQDFASVLSILGSGATASTVTAGTTNTASGPWVPWSTYTDTFQIGMASVILSASNFSLVSILPVSLPQTS